MNALDLTIFGVCLLSLAASVLVQARVLLVVGRALQKRGVPGAAQTGRRLAWICLLGLAWPVALGVSSVFYGPWMDRALLALAVGTFVFWCLCSILWRSWRPLMVFLGGLFVIAFVYAIFIAIALFMSAPGSERSVAGDLFGVVFVLVMCTLWHLVTGNLLMTWVASVPLRTGICLDCGYDTKGLPAGTVCPECGRTQ